MRADFKAAIEIERNRITAEFEPRSDAKNAFSGIGQPMAVHFVLGELLQDIPVQSESRSFDELDERRVV